MIPEEMTKSEDIHRMLLNMSLAPISTSIAAYKTAIKEITAYIDELEGKQVPKKPLPASDIDKEYLFGNEAVCPNCRHMVAPYNGYYCPWCGQLIDWEDEE